MMAQLTAEVFVVLSLIKINNKVTWEETIEKIRNEPEYQDLVRLAYFDANLPLNIERFRESEEYKATLDLFKKYSPNAHKILDVGSGNGISAINFALEGYQVTTVEPDKSLTIGSGAIRQMKKHYGADKLTVIDAFAEDIKFNKNSFDIVYVRQAMHHANNLEKFVGECIRVLKPNGLFITVRDHVIYDEDDKELFLRSHPLHKFYGGENAYASAQYKAAITAAGAIIKKELKYYDSVINYYPTNTEELEQTKIDYMISVKKRLTKKIGVLSRIPFVFTLYKKIKGINASGALNEKKILGRMYTYIAIKQ